MKPKLKKGIVATLKKGVRSIYYRGPRQFYFPTRIQAPVEQAMALMGIGSDQYFLSYGVMARTKDDFTTVLPD